MIDLDALINMGKETMELMYGVEGVGVFEPTLLAEYEDGHHEVTLIVGGLDNEALAEGLIHVTKSGPLRSLALTADANLRGTDQDALIVLSVGEEGSRTAMVPYILERTAHRAILVWDETVSTDSDPRLVGALQIALSASHAATMGE